MSATEPSNTRLGSVSSACASASRKAEMERVREMSVEERILAALSMKANFAWLQPTRIADQIDERRKD